jgi:hypothetical protein
LDDQAALASSAGVAYSVDLSVLVDSGADITADHAFDAQGIIADPMATLKETILIYQSAPARSKVVDGYYGAIA